MKTEAQQTVLDRIERSKVYVEYERAFGDATGMPLKLIAAEDWHLAHRGHCHDNAFCRLLAKQNKSCAAYLHTHDASTTTTQEQTQTVTCFAGILETAIPLLIGEDVIGFLCTGGVLSHPPTTKDFARVARRVEKSAVKLDVKALRDAYFRTRVVTAKRYESMLQLLRIFAKHLSLVVNQIVCEGESTEPASITKAREYINAHHATNLSLGTVAHAVQMSTFYFCKQFKKATGITFIDYLTRVRIEKAKEQLFKPNMRIGEVAYEVGFQSLTHFNRVFRKLNGEDSTHFRAHLSIPFAN